MSEPLIREPVNYEVETDTRNGMLQTAWMLVHCAPTRLLNCFRNNHHPVFSNNVRIYWVSKAETFELVQEIINAIRSKWIFSG